MRPGYKTIVAVAKENNTILDITYDGVVRNLSIDELLDVKLRLLLLQEDITEALREKGHSRWKNLIDLVKLAIDRFKHMM